MSAFIEKKKIIVQKKLKPFFAQHVFLFAEQKSLSDKKRFIPFYAAMELSCCFYK